MDFDDGTVKGRHVLAESLKAIGIEYVFGIVGYPVIELGIALQNVGIKYIGMRNEQAASYACAAYGYLTGKPAVCLVVPGPGVIHALAGMANASANGWPMLCVAGSSELELDGLGAFQESLPPQGGNQMQLFYSYAVCKYTAKMVHHHRIPFYVEQAVRYAKHGRPGPSYLEIAGDTLRDKVDAAKISLENIKKEVHQSDVRITLAPDVEVQRAVTLLQDAKHPLLVVGKGAAYCNASEQCRSFVKKSGIPFLPTPMGKGVISDEHDLCSSSARSFVLKNADVILLVGARLNWILHYGLPPRYAADVKFIHVELLPEEIDAGRRAEIGLNGHARGVVKQLTDAWGADVANRYKSWVSEIAAKKAESVRIFQALREDRSSPMNYYCALSIVNNLIPEGAVIVNEGSDTMDIGRTVLLNRYPKKRLDAATWGTMGVGMGQAIAAALVCPSPGCVFVAGDSAFGFSAMEFEVVTRYNLPIIVVILNNNGIGPWNPDEYSGDGSTASRLEHPAKSLAPDSRYEKIAEAFGGQGFFVETAEALEKTLKRVTEELPFRPTVINCRISTTAMRGKPAAPPFAKISKI